MTDDKRQYEEQLLERMSDKRLIKQAWKYKPTEYSMWTDPQ